MPLYEYRCLSCGRTREVLQKMNDAPLTICPDCSGELKRLVSAPAVQFKGTGWYVTDYAKKSGAPPSSSSSTGEKSGGGESSSGTETSSAAPAEKAAPAAEKPATPAPTAGS